MTSKQTATSSPQPVEHPTLAAAMAAFQSELPAVHKGAKGQVPGKREHKYADLADLSSAVLPVLGRHGLSWMTYPVLDDNSRLVLRWELLHTSSESRTGVYPIAGNDPWAVGSSLTYARRYCLSAVVGVAADEDDDGAAAQRGVEQHREQQRDREREQWRDQPRGQQRQQRQQRDQRPAGQQQPAGEHADDPMAAARGTLSTRIKAMGADAAAVDVAYREHTGHSIAQERDPQRIHGFIAGLNDGSVTIPQPEPDPEPEPAHADPAEAKSDDADEPAERVA